MEKLITSQLYYDKVQKAQELMEELLYLLEYEIVFEGNLDKELEHNIDVLFLAREKFDKERLKEINTK